MYYIPDKTVFTMIRSPAAGAILIVTLLIASDISFASREEIIPQKSNQKTLIETREAELERHSRINDRLRESREYEVSQRRARFANVTSRHEDESKKVLANKTRIDNNRNETSEVKDMTETTDFARVKNDLTNSNGSSAIARNNTGDKPSAVESETIRKNSTDNNTNEMASTATANHSITTTLPSIIAVTNPSPTTMSTSRTESALFTSTTEAERVVTTEHSPKHETIRPRTMNVGSTESSRAEMRLHTRKVIPMHSGIVALITAIAFAIVAVLAYVSLVYWRRYLEWRYGNRELLVNDFDINDYSSFEASPMTKIIDL